MLIYVFFMDNGNNFCVKRESFWAILSIYHVYSGCLTEQLTTQLHFQFGFYDAQTLWSGIKADAAPCQRIKKAPGAMRSGSRINHIMEYRLLLFLRCLLSEEPASGDQGFVHYDEVAKIISLLAKPYTPRLPCLRGLKAALRIL